MDYQSTKHNPTAKMHINLMLFWFLLQFSIVAWEPLPLCHLFFAHTTAKAVRALIVRKLVRLLMGNYWLGLFDVVQLICVPISWWIDCQLYTFYRLSDYCYTDICVFMKGRNKNKLFFTIIYCYALFRNYSLFLLLPIVSQLIPGKTSSGLVLSALAIDRKDVCWGLIPVEIWPQ